VRQETWDRNQLERSEADDAKWQAWLAEFERIMGEWERVQKVHKFKHGDFRDERH